MGLVRGDVEIHVRQRDWQAHGHHRDPKYNSVALHVVYSARTPFTRLPNGLRVPVISMRPLLDRPLSMDPNAYLWGLLERWGFPQPKTEEQMRGILDRAGEARFQEKGQAFETLMTEESPAQVLYAAIMEGLGYSQNRAPFLELAYRLPYSSLRAAAISRSSSQSVLLLTRMLRREAGFGTASEPGAMEVPCRRGKPMEAARWHLFRVRPENHPYRRIGGAAHLLGRYLRPGLMDGLLRLVREVAARMEEGLMVGAEEDGGVALIGRTRARDLAVNVVLPFAHALACSRDDSTLAQAALSLYHKYPKLQENEVTREMAEQLLPKEWRRLVVGACRQQGLIHLQRLLAGATVPMYH